MVTRFARLFREDLQRSFLCFIGTMTLYLWYQNWTHIRQVQQDEVNRKLGSNRVLDKNIVADTIAAQYNVGGTPVKCQLIRAGFNHNYVVEMPSRKKYVLRVYLNNKYYIRDADDFRFELDLIEYLATQHGLPVARPIATTTGDWLSLIEFDSDRKMAGNESFTRHAALFEFAPGVEVEQILRNGNKLGPREFKQLGELQARLHQAADQFPNPHNRHRYQQDVSTYLLDKSLQILELELRKHQMTESVDFFQSTAEAIRKKISELPKVKPYFGLIHGDLHPGNLFWDESTQQFTVIDWDHCAYGWRGYEFATSGRPDIFGAVIEGYEAVRKLSSKEIEFIPLFRMLREIWDMGDVLAFMPLWGEDPGPGEIQQQLKEYVGMLRNIVKVYRHTYSSTDGTRFNNN